MMSGWCLNNFCMMFERCLHKGLLSFWFCSHVFLFELHMNDAWMLFGWSFGDVWNDICPKIAWCFWKIWPLFGCLHDISTMSEWCPNNVWMMSAVILMFERCSIDVLLSFRLCFHFVLSRYHVNDIWMVFGWCLDDVRNDIWTICGWFSAVILLLLSLFCYWCPTDICSMFGYFDFYDVLLMFERCLNVV